MAKLLTECPACGKKLHIEVLRCAGCGMEMRNDFELSPFDLLTPKQEEILMVFLKHRGNMKALQNEMSISYPTAQKKLDDLLVALGLLEKEQNIQEKAENEEDPGMFNWHIQKDSVKASDIIKKKLKENNGKVVVHTINDLPCDIRAAADGKSFISDKLPISPPWRYEVFDVIVDLLLAQGGRAKKGNGRNYRLGDPKCDETTVVGAIGYNYSHLETGDSVYDPVFVLAAVLEWAGIASNRRGELVLTREYLEKL